MFNAIIAISFVLLANANTEYSDLTGGIFGNWTTDKEGLPAFEWTLNQRTDPRAFWPNSEDIDPIYVKRNDHFQIFGNDRINVIGVDDGYVSIVGTERGPFYANKFNEKQRNLGGGFSYVRINEENGTSSSFASAYKYAPLEFLNTTTRIFGMGYYLTSIVLNEEIQIEHLLFAPVGDDSVIIDQVTIRNVGKRKLSINHFEYFDVNRIQLFIEWTRTGLEAPIGDSIRDGFNSQFTQKVEYFDSKTLVASMEINPNETQVPNRDEIADFDYYPPDIFLRILDANQTIDGVYGNQNYFFGASNASEIPEAVIKLLPSNLLQSVDAYLQPAMLAMRTDHVIDIGEEVTLHYLYGYVPSNTSLSEIISHYPSNQVSSFFSENSAQWKQKSLIVDLPDTLPNSKLLERELMWRSYQLQSMSTYRDYYESHVIAQGSAYLYLHGADGAPRDQMLFVLGLVYLNPILAKETLKMIMQTCDSKTGKLTGVTDRAIYYSFVGYGVGSTALELHAFPSDLDIYLMLGLSEYLAVTGDFEFLDEEVNFYPKNSNSVPPGARVLDHVRAAFVHLTESIGTGEHGLLMIGDGDWDDGVCYQDPNPLAILFTILNGESVPNSQMAIYVLNQISFLIEKYDPEISLKMRMFAKSLVEPVMSTFTGKWFGRAWVRDSDDVAYLLANDNELIYHRSTYLNLQSQPWAFLSNLLNSTTSQSILNEIEQQLSSAIGPMLISNGTVWPAISQLMTWVYSKINNEKSWKILSDHMYATHAIEYPEVWMGILSGPDGWNVNGSYPGGTWASPVTPMTDFPVGNANPDAMFLMGFFRNIGIEMHEGGLLIDVNRIWNQALPFTLKTQLLELNISESGIDGIYNAFNSGNIFMYILPPNSEQTQNIYLSFEANESVPFNVTF